MLRIFIIGKIEDWKIKEIFSNKRKEKLIIYKWGYVKDCLNNMHVLPEIILKGEIDKAENTDLICLTNYIKEKKKNTMLLKI